jgi:hypothetical protein
MVGPKPLGPREPSLWKSPAGDVSPAAGPLRHLPDPHLARDAMELSRRRIAPLVVEFAAQYLVLAVHLMLSEAGLEVAQDGFDVALWIDRPDDPAVKGRHLIQAARRTPADTT